MKNKINRKGQLGETMTWVVATIIILVMTFAFVFVSGLLGKSRAGGSFGGGDSGIAGQKMLFAVLQKKAGTENAGEGKKIEELLNEGNYDFAESEIKKILAGFAEKGIKCDFDFYSKGTDVIKFRVKTGGEGKKVSQEIERGRTVMRC